MSALVAIELQEQNRILGGLLETLTDLDKKYPVGSIYFTENNTSPASLFGGSWTQIKGRFLVGAEFDAASGGGAMTYQGLSEGGSKDAVIPQHNHVGIYYNDVGAERRLAWGAGTNAGLGYVTYTYSLNAVDDNNLNTGEAVSRATGAITINNATDKNLPPYKAVFIWKRVA